MRWRINANGAQIDLPDDWGQTAQVGRVADIETYVKKYQRLPRVITKDYVTGERPKGPRTPTDVLLEGRQLERMWSAGQLTWERMAPDEQLALALATKHLKPDELTPEVRFTLGLPLSIPEQIAFGEKYRTHPTERSGWMGLGEAGRRAGESARATLTAPVESFPGANFMLKHLTPPANPARSYEFEALKRLPAEFVGAGERALQLAWGTPADVVSGMTEAPGWIGQRGSRAAYDVGVSAPLVGMGLAGVQALTRRLGRFFAPPSITPTGLRPEFQPPPVKPMPHGPYESGYQPMPEPPIAAPPGVGGPPARLPEPRPGPRALPPHRPGDAEFTVTGETRTAVSDPMAGEGWRRTPGPMISPRRPDRAPTAPPYQRALPPPPEGLQFGGPLDRSAPLPDIGLKPPGPPLGASAGAVAPPPPIPESLSRRMPVGRSMTTQHALETLGVPITPVVPRSTRFSRGRSVEPTPVEDRIPGGRAYLYETAREAYLQRARALHPDHGGSTEAMQELNRAWDFIERHYGPASPAPTRLPPEKPQAKPRTSTGKTKYQHVDLGTVNLSDPDEVRSLIDGLGGIRKADIEGIPFWMRGKDGVDFDVLVANIAKEQKRPHKEIERQLGHTLKRYDQLRADKRAKDAGKPRAESWETDVPDWVTDEDLWREE